MLYIAILALTVVALVMGYQWYQTYYGSNYKAAMTAQLSNKCATPPGYTDAQWKQHMSHHPDVYAECLK